MSLSIKTQCGTWGALVKSRRRGENPNAGQSLVKSPLTCPCAAHDEDGEVFDYLKTCPVLWMAGSDGSVQKRHRGKAPV